MKKIHHRFLKFKVTSLYAQLLSRTMLILAVLLILIGFVQYVVLKQFLYSSQVDSLQSRIRAISSRSWEMLVSGKTDDLRTVMSTIQERGVTVSFVDKSGKLYPLFKFSDFDRDHPNDEIAQLSPNQYSQAFNQRNEKRNYKIIKNSQNHNQLVLLSPIGNRENQLGFIQINYDTRAIDNTLNRTLLTFSIGSILALTAGLLVYLSTIRRTLSPLSQIITHVKQTDAGSLDQRLPEQFGQEEMNKLASSYNAMLERIETSFQTEREAKESMRRFVADASHELRTPLTSIHGFLEVLLRGAAKNPEQVEQSLKSMYRESERINKLVQDLLLLAKFDRKPTLDKKIGNLGNILNEMDSQLRILAEKRQVQILLRNDAEIEMDEDRIKQVILNVFYNAVQHTHPQKGFIQIEVDTDHQFTILKIKDNGNGISPEHLPYIFDRFYREESSRNRKSGGAGLGLSIAKSIIELHQGQIHVESHPQIGTTFTIQLPRTSEIIS